MVGAPDLQGAFGVSYAWTTTALLVVPTLAGILLEPVLLWLADRYSRRAFLCAGLGALALAAFGAAAAPSLAVMAAALALASAAGGCALGLGQATLMDEHPAERERYLARWSLLGMLGDLAAPVLVGIASSSALGWRGAFVCVGVASAVYAAALGRFPLPAPVATDETAAASRSVRDVLRNRRLVVWLSATALCGLLDEILVVFAALHLRDDLGLGPAARSAVLACFVAGAMVGLALVDRLLRRGDPVRLLAASAATCAVAFSLWVVATAPWLAAALLFLTGATAAPLYPISKAQAYRALPGDSAAVGAAGALFSPIELVLPFALGWLAEAAGLRVALLALLAQPVGVLVIAVAVRGYRR